MVMEKKTQEDNYNQVGINEHQKLIEKLRIRLNVLSASIFLLEDKLGPLDESAIS